MNVSYCLMLRIIPTRVGTSTLVRVRKKKSEDHPHACGDKSIYASAVNAEWGSSPRVWGQADFKNRATSALRIIPTRVGTRRYRLTVFFIPTDHPHACGDKTQKMIEKKYCEGSSPRVWGQDVIIFSFAYIHRIIPTRVGTRVIIVHTVIARQDHPHACGDKIFYNLFVVIPLGSSPRVWGQEHLVIPTKVFFRIIPTRVGTRRRTQGR